MVSMEMVQGTVNNTDNLMAKLYTYLKEKMKKKNKKKVSIIFPLKYLLKELTFLSIQEKGKLQDGIQAHHKVAPMVHAHPNLELLNKGKEGEETRSALLPVWEHHVLAG